MKKILLSLFVGLIGFISFGYCDNYTRGTASIPGSSCAVINSGVPFYWSNSSCQSYIHFSGSDTHFDLYSLYVYNYDVEVCNDRTSQCSYYYYENLEIKQCDDPYTSLECQTEYNLIPISSVDSAYCENNNLCSIYTGEISTGYSTLFINDIRHESMPFIYVNIPEEFNWDYSTGINDFTIDIEGYNVDTEYIDGIIRTQNYKPSSEDFTNLVGLLAPYTKYLVFLLFVFVVWAWIKKPFKSKKL